ncbi:hypothetical protein E2C01_093570 [Portunus trituberculatus]|uniref:Uncharacterized protein n=1 Tax=Portunus trituberculatus TaxID=210409 RepID=A0A5B7JUS2_PORTR|nr:hypothetical protein [Portunus trituberculatus]
METWQPKNKDNLCSQCYHAMVTRQAPPHRCYLAPRIPDEKGRRRVLNEIHMHIRTSNCVPLGRSWRAEGHESCGVRCRWVLATPGATFFKAERASGSRSAATVEVVGGIARYR